MSGSSGGGTGVRGTGGGGTGGAGDGGGGIPPTPPIDCARIMEKTILNSPVPEVINALKSGDILNVKLQGKSLVATTKEGKVAGALTPPLLPRIVQCIAEGHEYVAIVLSVSGGQCTVEVRIRSQIR
ncbi:MAG: hypothetical protein PHN75_12740 [Syntrophales bacterium]|nr:hypothetical protein [Syntrophales bacterium]